MIDSHGVTGCVGVDFGAARVLDPLVVRAMPVANACGNACSSACGSGHTFSVFGGTTPGVYTFIAGVSLTSANLTDYSITAGRALRYVVVCRVTFGPEDDDVAVDSITGTCN